MFKMQIWSCHPFVTLSPPKTFNGLSSLGIKPKLFTCSRKHCVAWSLWASAASSLTHLSSFSVPPTHCPPRHPSDLLCSFLLEAPFLCLECSPDSPLPCPQPLRSQQRQHSLRRASPGFHDDKTPKKAPHTSPHSCHLIFICVIIWLMFVLTH